MSDADTTAWIVREGQEVLGSDGKKVGEVTGSAGSALVVKHGFLFTARDIYVPVSAIANIDTQSVHLNVAADVATSDAWSQPPAGASFVPNVASSASAAETLASAAPAGDGDTWTISEGMAVIGSDGEHIGEVEDGSEDAILVRVGRFFSKTISISAAQISDVRQNAVLVTTTRRLLNIANDDESQGADGIATAAAGTATATGDMGGNASGLTPATSDLAASALGLSVSKDDVAHSTDDLAGAAADNPSGASTPLADLQGRITNAWRSSGTQADDEAGSVDLGKPDPEFPITPPTGETPYVAPAETGTAASLSAAADTVTGGPGDALGADAPDLSIDTPDVAAEVPGLNLTNAGIPAASEGGFAATTNSFSFDTPDSSTADNAVSALSDAGAIGESPDPNLASEAQELAARESFGEHGYPDLPSDPFETDGNATHLDVSQASGAAGDAIASAQSRFGDSMPPVDLPGDRNADTLPDAPSFETSVGDDLLGSTPAADVDTTPLHADITGRASTLGSATSGGSSADADIAATRSSGPGASLPPAATGAPREQPASSSHESKGGLFGQIRHRIQTFFDPHAAEVAETRSGIEAPKPSSSLPGAAVAGAAGVGAAATERAGLTTPDSPVDINANAPDVDVDARIPDAPSLADASASLGLTRASSDAEGIASDAQAGTDTTASTQADDEPGLFGGMKEKVESFLDGPTGGTDQTAGDQRDSTASAAADTVAFDNASLPDADTVAADEFAQELYVSDPDINGFVRTVTPSADEAGADTSASARAETESATYDDQRHIDRGSGESEFAPQVSEHPTLDTRSELEPDVDRSSEAEGERHEGFFEEIREKVEHFLDNPDAAEEPALGTFDYATPADLEHAAGDVATPTSGITDTTAPTIGAPAADAAPHLMDDATTTAHLDQAPEVSGTDTTTAFDRTARDTADTSAFVHDGTDTSTDTSFSVASADADDDLLASTSGTDTSESTGTTATPSRYSVVGEHDDDDDLYDSISGIDDTGDATLDRSDARAGASSEVFASDVSIEGASPQFEARAGQAATEGDVDVNVDESAAIALGDDHHATETAGTADEGEQAESDVFAAIVDATDESDLDDFGTAAEHLTHAAATDDHDMSTDAATSDADSSASSHLESFTPTSDATLLADIPAAEDSSSSTTGSDIDTKTSAADETTAGDGTQTDAGDDTIAANAESGTLADAAEHVATWTSSEAESTGEHAATFTPTPFSGDETIARNAISGEMEGASDAAADATRQDRTIGENARSGKLAGAGDLARSWTGSEAGATRANAESAIAGETPSIPGARPLSESTSSPSGTSAEEAGDTGTTASEGDGSATMYGPADTEGIDWAPAVEGQDAPHGWLVKGNADSGIYHTPESSSYERTIPEVWFPTAEAAERAGFRAPRSGHQTAEQAVPATQSAAEAALAGTTGDASGTMSASAVHATSSGTGADAADEHASMTGGTGHSETGAGSGAHASTTDHAQSAQDATDSEPAAAKGHGPAETEGIDWIAAVEGQAPPHGWVVKGNAGSGIYHTPESPSYEQTKPEAWFPNAAAAERAGFRAPRSGHQTAEQAVPATEHAASAALSGTTDESSSTAEASGASGTTDSSSLGVVDAAASGSSVEDEYDGLTVGHEDTGVESDAQPGMHAHAESSLGSDTDAAEASSGHGPAETEGIDWVTAVEGQDAPHGWLVKGNADSGIYHTPESSSYERTIPEVWFPTAEAAERAGFRAPRSGHQTAEQAVPATESAAEAALAGTTEGSSATESGSASSSSTASDAAGTSSAETVAGNAESGSLADASSAATSWTHGERATTQHGDDAGAFTPSTYASSAAGSGIDDQDTDAGHHEDTSSSEAHGSGTETHAATAGEHIGSAGATTTGASSPAIVNDAERHQHARTLRRRGPAATEGIDWIAAIPGEHAPEGWPVKGNADSGIYHVPEALSYEKTKPEAWFPSAEAAERSGYRAPRAQRQAGEHGAPAAKSGAANAITGSHADTSSSGTSGSTGSGSHDAHRSETAFSAGTTTSEGREHVGMTGGAHTGADTDAGAHASTSAHAASGAGDAEATSGHGPAETEGIDWATAVEGEPAPHGWLVKGNADSGIYHTPESSSYERTIPEVWFPTAEAAERAGFRAPRSAHHAGEAASDSSDAAAKQAKDRLDNNA